MRIRDANESDAPSVGAILSEFVDTTDWMPRLHTHEEDRGFCEKMIGSGWVRVAEIGGDICGFIARNDQEVNALYVRGDARSQGVGGALLKEAQEMSPELELWTFQENIAARRFYADHGFYEISRTNGETNDERLPDIQLQWRRS